MLSFETPHVEADGIILFPDHEDPLLWYYSAADPRLAIGPGRRPMFDLWIYTEALVHSFLGGTQIPQEMGGGFLTLGVNCRHDDAALRRARKAVARALSLDDEDRVTLSPIPYSEGKVSLIALDAVSAGGDTGAGEPAAGRPRFVTAVLGAGRPALLGDLQAIFSISLSDRGAAFMSGMFENGGMPVGVVYELSFQGLSPAVQVVVRADMDKLRQHFGGGLQGQVQWFRADVSAAIDQLVQTNAVQIESSILLDADAAREAEARALALFKEDIIQTLFRPSLPQPPQPAPGQGLGQAIAALGGAGAAAGGGAAAAGNAAAAAATGGSLGLTLKFQHETADLSGEFRYDARMPSTRTDAPQAFLQTLIAPQDHASHTTVINLGTASAFFDRVEAIVSLPEDAVFAELNLRQAVVSMSYGDDDPQRPPEIKPPLICRPGGERHRLLAFLRNGRPSMAVSYDITYEFDDPVDATVDASRYVTPRQTSSTRAVMIDPRGDFGYRRLVLRPGRIPADVREIGVEARFRTDSGGFAAERRFRLLAPFDRPVAEVAPEGADWPIRTREKGFGRFDLRPTYVFAEGGTWTAASDQARAPLHTLDAPFRGERQLIVQPNVLSPSVEGIDVEVEYNDPAAAYARSFRATLTPPFAALTLRWSILDPARQQVRIRATVREGGIVSRGDWVETPETIHIVGTDAARPDLLTLRLIGGDLAAAGLDAVLVELRAPDETGQPRLTELFFGPGDPLTAQATLIRRPGQPLSYEFRTHAFRSTGDSAVSDWQTRTDGLQLIISLRTL
ncbi:MULTISPECIES: hypothetical protein [unclassified Paracoccus (in: a-proteobacteria)]|uniref:hypothetical protein n=1 Tax=unclassified Paracoccus (in: a-proteobacteria) TaxID=2688777 RepID=UPI0021E14797|nr:MULTISPECIES: hypothetical protein [unclassified Paracoccus (in: a-proteobacteria)]UXU76510.1 hypothetical protein GB879_014130 [Paracoccus sp. SMMA_5]UXU82423.1 hypothetical protein GB880_014305 [Paracoccus sp. SMMA_5_TC]